MEVWTNKEKFLKEELQKSREVMEYINEDELSEIFDTGKILMNVDYIFQRSIFAVN